MLATPKTPLGPVSQSAILQRGGLPNRIVEAHALKRAHGSGKVRVHSVPCGNCFDMPAQGRRTGQKLQANAITASFFVGIEDIQATLRFMPLVCLCAQKRKRVEEFHLLVPSLHHCSRGSLALSKPSLVVAKRRDIPAATFSQDFLDDRMRLGGKPDE